MCAMGLEKLTRLAKVDYGFPFESSLFTDNSVYMPLIRIRDIKPAKASTYYEGEYSDRYVVRKGDILVGMDGEFNLERWNDRDGLLNQRILRIKAIDGLSDESYLYHLLAPLFKNIEKKVQGGSVKHLSAKIIESLYIPYVDFEEQVLIGKHLDTFTTLISNLESELYMRRKQYEHYRNQLLDFEGVEGVEWKTLGEFCKFKYGYTAKADDNGSYRYIRITDIDECGRLYKDNAKYIGEYDDLDGYVLEKKDIVVARTGATFGKTLIFEADYPAVYASFLIKIDLKGILLNKYYWHFAQSKLYWMQANKLVGGGAQPQFNTGALSQIIIPIPSKQTQQEIVEKLDAFENLIQSLEQEIKLRKQQYEYYREKLLTFE